MHEGDSRLPKSAPTTLFGAAISRLATVMLSAEGSMATRATRIASG